MKPNALLATALIAVAAACDYQSNDCARADSDHGFSVTGAVPGAAYALHTDADSPFLDLAGARVQVRNPTAADCLVAIYASTVAPDAAHLPDLDRGAVPPESIETLGVCIAYFNLARTFAEPDRDEVYELLDLALRGATDFYVTIATCSAGGIEGTVSFAVRYCDHSPHIPGTTGVQSQTTSVEKLW